MSSTEPRVKRRRHRWKWAWSSAHVPPEHWSSRYRPRQRHSQEPQLYRVQRCVQCGAEMEQLHERVAHRMYSTATAWRPLFGVRRLVQTRPPCEPPEPPMGM